MLFGLQKIERMSEDPFEKPIHEGVYHATRLLQDRFEDSPQKEDNLEFHNTHHTENVIQRAERIFHIIQTSAPDAMSEKDVALGVLAAAFHDVVQEWKENQSNEKVVRQRLIGENEQASADEAALFLRELHNEAGERVFSDEDIQIVTEAIHGTIPDFSVERKTVIQPNITEKSSLIAKVLALADLGAAGMDGALVFLKEGDALFREENIDITRSLEHPESITDEEKKSYQKRMLEWSRSQSDFAAGRRDFLDQELQGIPQEAKSTVKKLFGKFDESISAATQHAKEREDMSFEELAIDTGFLKEKTDATLIELGLYQRAVDEKKIQSIRKALGSEVK